ncbi:MAG: hypothetical protein F6K14_16890 [Symploca sp. SIO2C1]|nr:hypothetical protein [Symploca sp. SIO2C1]
MKVPLKTIKITSVSFFTALFTTAVIAQPGQTTTLSPTQQVGQVVKWFTGFFTNNAQVASNSDIPFLTMENCSASVLGSGNSTAQYVHLEQYIGGVSLLRTAAYEFSPGDNGVNLKVFPYLNDSAALGSCDRATPQIDLSNLVSTSCDLNLVYKSNQFFGTNSPVGCPTSFPVPESTVVSTVTISADAIDSFDEFSTPFGTSFGTPIEFQRVAKTPEPGINGTLISLGLVGLVAIRKR